MTEKRRPISTHARLRELLLSHYRGKLKVRHPHYFKRIVEPHMITHRRVALPNVERRLTEIDFILGQDSNYGRLHNLQCSRVPSWKYCPGKQNDTKDYRNAMKEAQSDLLEYHMDKQSITQERVVNPPSLSLSYILRLTQAGILRVDLLRPHCFSSGVMKFFFNFSIS